MHDDRKLPTDLHIGQANPASILSPQSISHLVRDYTDLEGGQGRDVFFRPDRYQRSDLGPIRVAVELHYADESHSCELHNVSQNGVGFEWPRHLPVEVGTVLDAIIVKFDDYEAYRGRAEVRSVRREEARSVVGVSLLDTLMNIDDVLHLRDVKAWPAGPDPGGLGFQAAPWRVPGQDHFKASVAELRLFLQDACTRFAELESSLPFHVTHGEQESPARKALVERIYSGFVTDLVAHSNDVDTALRTASPTEREPLREYSLRQVHEFLMQSPWMHRAHQKPLGYPGDYEVMNSVYNDYFKGNTLFAKALNFAFAWTPGAVAVRSRKDLLKERMASLLNSPPPGRPTRILSIAAGPAQEIFELLQERRSFQQPLEIVLFDQDKRALSYSYARLKRIVDARWRDQVRVVHLHDSIRRILRGSTIFTTSGHYDFIYAAGLFDYLQRHTWTLLCQNLFSALQPGGCFYIGNMTPSNPSRWFMELHLDWFIVYRERHEMLELARAAIPDAHIAIADEPTGVNPFVALTKE